jgi:antitoxin VapB
MHTARLFQNNRNQAVRLPRAAEFASDVQEVSIVTIGRTRIISPVDGTWDNWFAQATTDDAKLPEREQPVMQERKALK